VARAAPSARPEAGRQDGMIPVHAVNSEGRIVSAES
jgi:hypothetical protein